MLKQQRERRKRRVGRRNTVGFMMIVFILGFLAGMSVWTPGVVHAETVTESGEDIDAAAETESGEGRKEEIS